MRSRTNSLYSLFFHCLFLCALSLFFCLSTSFARADCPSALRPRLASDMQPVRILLQWMPQAQFAGYIVALEKGFFEAEGLPRVELYWTNRGESPVSRLAQGEVDFCSVWLVTALQRRSEGLPIVNVAQLMHKSASLIVARKDKNIHKPEDLNGKIILSWGGDFAFEFELFLHNNGIKPAHVLPLSSSLAPFLYGLADATQAMEYSEYHRLLERGMKKEDMTIFHLAKHGVNLVGDGLYTTTDYLTKNRAKVQAVRRAVLRGWHYAFTHEDEAVDYVLAHGDGWNFRSNRNYQLEMLRNIRSLMEYRVGADPKNWGILRRDDFNTALTTAQDAGFPLGDEKYEDFFQIP